MKIIISIIKSLDKKKIFVNRYILKKFKLAIFANKKKIINEK